MKTYDSDLRNFKLLESVSFIGVLEFTKPQPWQDSQMSEVNEEDFGSGVPQDSDLPHLHVLCHERNYIMNKITELPLAEVTETAINDNSQMLSDAKQKIVAVLALIFGGDKVAAEYCLVNLISRVYHTEGTLHIGNIPLNITGLDNNHATILV